MSHQPPIEIDNARGQAGKVENQNNQRRDFTLPASKGNWWGAQPCICRGTGVCLSCRRWSQVLDGFAVRGVFARGEG